MKRINLSQLMARAWRIYRKTQGVTFGEALHRSWLAAKAEPINAQRIETAKAAAGIAEEVKTWAGWKAAGDGAEYAARFFGASQVQAAA